ncbi:hypothetical protein ATJ97_1204 [Georgenia soli]|uniref:4-amino-4-deoxy-L-arabinose transferase-like glycosyltransferase n=1 Tax=Georgenia soli TaxID=638953 RepID=A0A2A9EIK1_9MICO|nr:DUF6541 family protein [Georgenia soli]PFG38718.1 hypothetical protein ATJ97_1204 [Georgenia soli]
MTWAGVAPPGLLLWAGLLLPGWAFLRPLGVRGLVALGAAPAVSTALAGVLGLVYPLVGVRWNLLTAAAGVCGGILLAVAAGLVLGTAQRRSTDERHALWLPPPLPYRSAWPLLGSTLVACVLVGGPMAAAMTTPESPAQAWDAVFHLNAIASIQDTGNASVLGGLAPLYGGRPTYYPSVWHALVAVAPGFTSVVPAANTAALVVGAPVWLVGMAAFTRVMVHQRDLPVLVAPVLAATFVAFPVVVLTVLAQEPMGLSMALLPGALTVLVVALRTRWFWPAKASAALALLAAGAGVALAHGSGAFSMLALGGLPVAVVLARQARQGWAAGRPLAVVAGITAAAGVLATVVVLLAAFPAFLATLSYERAGSSSYLPILAKLITDTPQVYWYGMGFGNVVVMALALAGAVLAFRHRRGRRLVAVLLVAVALVLLAAGPPENPLRTVTGVWYTQAARIAPLAVVPAVVLASGAFGMVADRLTRQVPGRYRKPAARAVPVALLVLVVVLTGGARWDLKSRITASVHEPGAIAWGTMLTRGELAMIERLPDRLPPDAVVLGDPFNGSAYLPALAGVDVVLPQLGPVPGAERRLLEASFRDLHDDPAVCGAARALGVTHVYTDTADAESGAKVSDRTAGLRDIDTSSGFTLVDSGGTAAVWQLTACSVTGL